MFQYVHSAAIIVADIDKALEFYVGVLGFEVRTDAPMGPDMRFTTVAPKGAQTEIVLGQRNMYGEDAKTIGSGISLIVDDVDKVYEELSAKGVEFPMPPFDAPWGARGANFNDPEGNTFFISTAAS